jgi:hypothetical protein
MKSLSMNAPETGDSLTFRGEKFVVADPTGVLTEPNPEDMEEIAAIVRNAESLSDYTVVSIHAHEGDGDRSVPARFVVDFARRMIDEGPTSSSATVLTCLGIEIYKGKRFTAPAISSSERDPAAAAKEHAPSDLATTTVSRFQRRPLRSRLGRVSASPRSGVGRGGAVFQAEELVGRPPHLSDRNPARLGRPRLRTSSSRDHLRPHGTKPGMTSVRRRRRRREAEGPGDQLR